MKQLRSLAIGIVALFILSCYSFLVYKVGEGGNPLGSFSGPFKQFVTFPQHLSPVLNHLFSPAIPPSFIAIEEESDFPAPPAASLPYPLLGLLSFWEEERDTWVVRLLDLQNDNSLKEWAIPEDDILLSRSFLYNDLKTYVKSFKEMRPLHSLMDRDSSLIVSLHESTNLLKLSSDSKLLWRNSDFIYHHALNFDADSTLWICGSPIPQSAQGTYSGRHINDFQGQTYSYRDDLLIQIDPQTGEVIYTKSVTDILLENKLKHLLFGVILGPDPIHLNDIEPTWDSCAAWERGDLFLSLRHRSLILQFRPSTNEVIRTLQGPFLFQHDIDIQGEGKISIFNNNSFEAWASTHSPYDPAPPRLSVASEIILYDLVRGSFTIPFDSLMQSHRVATASEGLHEFLPNGDVLIESQNQGRLLVFNKKKLLWEKIFLTEDKRHMNLLNWIRIIEAPPNSIDL